MEPQHQGRPGIRASDQDRDATVHRLQVAFGEGRLTGEEFDGRMRTALAARTQDDLDTLLTDLPADTSSPLPHPAGLVDGPKPGRYTVAYKKGMRRAGRWRVPDSFRAVIYKGEGVIDLRAAELTAPVTKILVYAYKSGVEVIVPPGVRVEATGIGVDRDEDWDGPLPADAPVIHVRGYAYKGQVETRTATRR